MKQWGIMACVLLILMAACGEPEDAPVESKLRRMIDPIPAPPWVVALHGRMDAALKGSERPTGGRPSGGVGGFYVGSTAGKGGAGGLTSRGMLLKADGEVLTVAGFGSANPNSVLWEKGRWELQGNWIKLAVPHSVSGRPIARYLTIHDQGLCEVLIAPSSKLKDPRGLGFRPCSDQREPLWLYWISDE